MEKSEKILEKKTLVMGASLKPERYSNKAIKSLRKHGLETIAVGLREGQVEDVVITKAGEMFTDIHTITVYVGADRLADSIDYLLSLKPKRIIFNPGAENPEFAKRAKEQGIEIVQACTLVMLATDQY